MGGGGGAGGAVDKAKVPPVVCAEVAEPSFIAKTQVQNLTCRADVQILRRNAPQVNLLARRCRRVARTSTVIRGASRVYVIVAMARHADHEQGREGDADIRHALHVCPWTRSDGIKGNLCVDSG